MSPDEGLKWGEVVQWVLNVFGGIVTVTVAFMFNWMKKVETKIEDVRKEVLERTEDGDEILDKALDKVQTDFVNAFREYREDLKAWQAKQTERWEEMARWRENMVSSTPTRVQLDRKLDEIVERLDERVAPLLQHERSRRARNRGEPPD